MWRERNPLFIIEALFKKFYISELMGNYTYIFLFFVFPKYQTRFEICAKKHSQNVWLVVGIRLIEFRPKPKVQ